MAKYHAEKAGAIMRKVGYPDDSINRGGDLLLKRRRLLDEEVQLFEDAICLVFLECEMAEFAGKHEGTKVESVLRKTWNKMSHRGHEEAFALSAELPREIQALLRVVLQ